MDHLLLRATIVVAAAFPIFYGLAAMLRPSIVVRVTWTLSRGQVALNDQNRYLLKPLGLYIFMAGALLAFSATDPLRFRVVVLWGAAILFMRGLQRIFITRELFSLFGVPPRRNFLNVAYLFALATTLVALCPEAAA